MNRLIVALGLVFAGLLIYYLTAQSREEDLPGFVTYGLGIAACLFFTVLLYRLMQYFKKK